MNFRFSIFDFRYAHSCAVLSRGSTIVLVLGCALASGLAAEGNRSLSDLNLESTEARVTADALLAQNETLRKQLSLERESILTLTESLAASNAEAELFRRKFSDLQLRMEALGLDSASDDRAKLEQRLLHAVSDLQLAHKERDQYRDQMLRLTEAIFHFLQTSQGGGDPQARMDVEEQLRSTAALMGGGEESATGQPNLLDASVVSVKEEWSLVVANVGEEHGVKIGMPLRVMRDDRVVATLRVVDVRRKISGAVVQEMSSAKEKIRVGDRLRVDARQEVSVR